MTTPTDLYLAPSDYHRYLMATPLRRAAQCRG